MKRNRPCRAWALGLALALLVPCISACKEQIRVKVKVRTRDAGTRTSSTTVAPP